MYTHLFKARGAVRQKPPKVYKYAHLCGPGACTPRISDSQQIDTLVRQGPREENKYARTQLCVTRGPVSQESREVNKNEHIDVCGARGPVS